MLLHTYFYYNIFYLFVDSLTSILNTYYNKLILNNYNNKFNNNLLRDMYVFNS